MLAPTSCKKRACWPPAVQKKKPCWSYWMQREYFDPIVHRGFRPERDREWWLDFVQREGVANFMLGEHAGFVQNRVQCHEILNYFLTSCLFFCRKKSFVVVLCFFVGFLFAWNACLIVHRACLAVFMQCLMAHPNLSRFWRPVWWLPTCCHFSRRQVYPKQWTQDTGPGSGDNRVGGNPDKGWIAFLKTTNVLVGPANQEVF